MRIAVIGKGGLGKSVIAGTLARIAARDGAQVLALDSDPLPGLRFSLGSGPEPAEPLLLQAVEQDATGRFGWRQGVTAVSAAQRFASTAPDGVRVLHCGKVAGDGSRASAGATKAVWEVAHGIVDAPEFREWTLIGDLPAGARQTAEDWAPYAHTYLVVVQPTVQSALTARRVARLARQQSPDAAIAFVANRVTTKSDVPHIESWIGEPVFASVPVDEELATAERLGVAPIDHAPDSPAIEAMRRLAAALEAPATR